MITQAQASIGGDGIARVKLNDIPVGIDAIVFAELSFSNGTSTEVVYAGNSDVFKVKPTDNKVSLVLMKVVDDDEPPTDINPPVDDIPSEDDDEIKSNITVTFPSYTDVEGLKIGFQEYDSTCSPIIPAGYEFVAWYVDGEICPDDNILNYGDFDVGSHTIMLVVKYTDGNLYSVEAILKINEE